MESYILSFDEEVPSPLSAESATLLREVQATLTIGQDGLNKFNRGSPQQSPLLPDVNLDGALQGGQHDENQDVTRARDVDSSHSSNLQDSVPPEHLETHVLHEDVLDPLPDLDDFMNFQGLERDSFDGPWTLAWDNPLPPPASGAPLFSDVPPMHDSAVESGEGVVSDLYDSSDDESVGEIIEQLSIRLGGLKIVDDGTLRFFGPTSNMTLSPAGTLYRFGHVPDVQSPQTQIKIENLITLAQFEHFLNLYFCWQNSFLPLVDREVFEDDLRTHREGQEVLFCSESLKLSM